MLDGSRPRLAGLPRARPEHLCGSLCRPGPHISPLTGSRGTTSSSSGDALGKALASVRRGMWWVAEPVTPEKLALTSHLVALCFSLSHHRSTPRITQAITSPPAPPPPWAPHRAWQVCAGYWGRGPGLVTAALVGWGAGPTICLSSCSHGCLPGCRGGQPGGGGSQVRKQAEAGRECSMHCKSCRGRGIQQRPGVPKSQSRHGRFGVYSPPRLLVRHPLYASCCALEGGSGLRRADQGLWSVWAVLTVPIGLYGVLGA